MWIEKVWWGKNSYIKYRSLDIKIRKEVNKMSKTIYKLYDYYEGKQLVGEYDDWFELKKARKEYIADTDGECDLDVEEYDIWE